MAKIAVIVNELGEVGIDGDLIVKDEDSILELSNGCLCCAMIGDLTKIIMDLQNGNNLTTCSSKQPVLPILPLSLRFSIWTRVLIVSFMSMV